MIDTKKQVYAGFWIRFAASLVDIVFFTAISWPFLSVTHDKIDLMNPAAIMGANTLISWVLPVVVTVACWYYLSGTPGKLLFGLAIVDEKTGGKIRVSQSCIRYLGYIVDIFSLGWGIICLSWDDKKQAWHDKMAGSVVIKKNRFSK